jgi:hypothetical protein
MHKHNVKRGVVVVVVFLILINFTNLIQAFGVSTPYLENDTLSVASGHNYTYALTIQNGDIQDYYVDISYSSTDNIASLRKTSYFVPSNTYNNTFYFDISIPKDAQIGQKYVLEYGAKPRMNESASLTVGVEIKRHITIEVASKDDNVAVSLIQEPEVKDIKEISSNDDNMSKNSSWPRVWRYALILIILALAVLITNRLWRLSKGISSKFNNEKVTTYTISQAINLKEVQELLEKISDEEFKLQEIKNLFKEKISELTTHNLNKEIKSMSRKDVIKAIDKIR